jgi:hypothetical protein
MGRPSVSKIREYPAVGGLLVRIVLDEGQRQETRHYWVTMNPLRIGRFGGDAAGLMSARLNDFFQADHAAGESLSKLNVNARIQYSTFEHIDAARRTAQFVAGRLLAPHLPKARDAAFQVTGPELSRENLHQSLLDLLPFRTCVQAVGAGESYRAVLFCVSDALSLIPLLGAGVRATSSAMRVASALSSTLSLTQARRLAAGLLTGTVTRDIAPQMISSSLRVGVPLLDVAKQAAHWANPMDGLASGLSWATMRLNGGASLRRRLRRLPTLDPLAADIERHAAVQRVFYADRGLWRARPDAVSVHRGQRQLRLAGKIYPVVDIGERADVLTIQCGRELRLLNPESGLPYGPVLNREALEASRGRPGAHRLAGGCRSKRDGSDVRIYAATDVNGCSRIERSAQFGWGSYVFAEKFPYHGVQARMLPAAAGGMVEDYFPVDLSNIGFVSYSWKQRDGKFTQVYNSRYFVFDDRIWIAENGRLRPTSIEFRFPDYAEGTVIYSDADGMGPDYLAFDVELPPIPGTDKVYYNRFIVPYANYPGDGGKCMGLIEPPGAPYKFSFSGKWFERLPAGEKVTLRRISVREYRVYEQYRQIHADESANALDKSSLRKLKDVEPAMQQRFDTIVERAEKLIDDAERALKSGQPAVKAILNAFMPKTWDVARKEAFVRTFKYNVKKVRGALPIVKRNKSDIIGFGTVEFKQSVDGATLMRKSIRAEALSGSMVQDMDYSHIKKALIYFEQRNFEAGKIDSGAADLLHELSHAKVRTRDTIGPAFTEQVYPHRSVFDHNIIDISPLVAAAGQSGSDSANHAGTFEHLVLALAYTQSPDTVPLLNGLLGGGTRFSHRPDPVEKKCSGECILLR